jgi:hypothetical protein
LPCGVSPTLRKPSHTEPLGKSLRIFRVSKAEHHEVTVIAAQGARSQSRHYADAGHYPDAEPPQKPAATFGLSPGSSRWKALSVSAQEVSKEIETLRTGSIQMLRSHFIAILHISFISGCFNRLNGSLLQKKQRSDCRLSLTAH